MVWVGSGCCGFELCLLPWILRCYLMCGGLCLAVGCGFSRFVFNSVVHDANTHSLFASFVCCFLFSVIEGVAVVVYYVVWRRCGVVWVCCLFWLV